MIVLDTHVLSALMRAAPEAAVVAWLDRQPAEAIWTPSITVFEARLGIAVLPAGRRRQARDAALTRRLGTDLEDRIVSFDAAAAHEAAQPAARRQAAGRPVDFRDAQIAGIVLARRATLATRNVRHFADLATPAINPRE